MRGFTDAGYIAPGPRRQTRWSAARFLAAGVLVVLIIGVPVVLIDALCSSVRHDFCPWSGSGHEDSGPFDFKWSSIDASETLQFHSCYDGLECAKLKLPLDYFNGTHSNKTISLALAKLPAQVPVDDPRYAGPMLINPGGPGGSGVGLAVAGARSLQTIVDSSKDPNSPEALASKHASSARYYDVIGFDPRGIGATEPAAECLPDGPTTWSWDLRRRSEGNLDSSDAALGRLWSMEHAWGASCKQVMDEEDGPDIKQYMTTASVARDMLEIIERHADYVADHLAEKRKTSSTVIAKKPKLQYWGFSYGTYLGYTFASMFPDRVGRLVLDGVVNSDDYNASLGKGSLHDAEKAQQSIYSYCAAAGPDKCALARSGSTPKDIEERVHTILSSVYHNPIPLSSPYGPEVLTWSDVRMVLFASLYQPSGIFPLAAQLLLAVEARSGEILEEYALGMRPLHVYSCPVNGTVGLKLPTDVPEIAILCSDGEVQNGDYNRFEDYWHDLEKTSPTSGAIWSTLRIKCLAWKIRAAYRFTGKFGANTSHPILFVSNTADPVTPLVSGRIMSERFPGSVQLIQDSAGHCSSALPTPCTINAIKKYFQTGILPEPHTVCIPPSSPFSMNSTDPDSPFYDSSLLAPRQSETLDFNAQAVHMWVEQSSHQQSQELLLGEAGQENMEAAEHFSRWFAENGGFFPTTHNRRRVNEVIRALSTSDDDWVET
ncbi:TAP-like protein-domain-containing protein [Lophiotrema nucula]|uniref:TAP-like protein-domain-containing protein n=1 Tax=Lophiotrema nucula TaxID=690887 RepID=A0A6A5ZH80_9PLEO|nr:TAP-like protein-domain-containing protein [Lophiotrema nucula]